MKTSARNKFDGQITKITQRGILADVELTTKDGLTLKSTITTKSSSDMGIAEGKHCSALIKAPFVRVATDPVCHKKDQNCFPGVIESIRSDEFATEIIGKLSTGHSVCAVYYAGDNPPTGLAKGADVRFHFSPAEVILID